MYSFRTCGCAQCIIIFLPLVGRLLRSTTTHSVGTHENKQHGQCHQCPRLQPLDDEHHGTTPCWCFFTCEYAMKTATPIIATPKKMRTQEPLFR